MAEHTQLYIQHVATCFSVYNVSIDWLKMYAIEQYGKRAGGNIGTHGGDGPSSNEAFKSRPP